MTAPVVPSPTVTFIDWAKANAAIAGLVGTSVSSKHPGDVFPWVEVRMVPGIVNFPEASVTTARLQINVLGGRKGNGFPNWAVADPVVRTLIAEIKAFSQWESGDAHLADLSLIEEPQQLEDPDTGDARYWMDIVATVRRSDGQ